MQTSEVGRERRSPVDDSVTWSGTWVGPDEVASTVQRVADAFPNWSQKSLEQRIEYVKKYADFLRTNRAAIGRTITLESGKPLWESDQEIQSAIVKVDTAVDAIIKRRWTTREGTGQSFSAIRYKPLGMMVVLGP